MPRFSNSDPVSVFADITGVHFRRTIMKSEKFAVVAVVLCLCALSPRPTAAQQFYGSITGTVIDPSGAVVPNASVNVIKVDTNVTIALRTNSAGVYTANNLVVGTYRVEAEAAGFKKSVVDRVTVNVGATPKVDLSLAVGQSSETVEVTANNAPILQTQQTDLGQTLNSRELEQMPTQSS